MDKEEVDQSRTRRRAQEGKSGGDMVDRGGVNRRGWTHVDVWGRAGFGERDEEGDAFGPRFARDSCRITTHSLSFVCTSNQVARPNPCMIRIALLTVSDLKTGSASVEEKGNQSATRQFEYGTALCAPRDTAVRASLTCSKLIRGLVPSRPMHREGKITQHDSICYSGSTLSRLICFSSRPVGHA